ncbi:MAG: response regulator [Candidatus Sumerlaeia bacterium]|nr:response regulator [Candidatus Sumerlaeia bacterium]
MTKSTTILLVEDDPAEAHLIQHSLDKTDYMLQHVRDGDAAIAYLSGEGAYADRERYPLPRLLLLDLKLPGKSGYDVLAWIRQQAGFEKLPVVVLTGRMETADITDAYDRGANFYLVKPVAFGALQDMVETLKRFLADA